MFGKKMHPNLYLEFSDTGLTVAPIIVKRKQYIIDHCEHVPFSGQEFMQGVPGNISLLFMHIKQVLHLLAITKPYAILVCSTLQGKSEFLQKSIVLQLSLCCGKAGICIDRVLQEGLL